MAALASLLPQPVHAPIEDEEEVQAPVTTTLALAVVIPPYGQRKGWRPSKQADFGDGGAYPECHIAQYPLDLGKKKANPGNTLALQVDSEGNVRYDAIAHQGHRDGRRVQSQFKDLVPIAHRNDLTDEDRLMERPSEDEIKAAQPKNVPDSTGKSTFVRYTPSQQNGNGMNQRIIKITESPPPVLRSPPRKATAAEQKEWMIPPCISNWKNNKGFTIPLDKRLAADGRGLQDVHINDNFAKFSESLFIADRHAREEVRQRSLMQQKIVEKEKAAKEEQLREMAQRARAERGGLVAPSAGGSGSATAAKANMSGALAGYGSGSDESGSGSEDEDEGEDEEAARVRDEMRREKRQEREREMRMNNMGTEQRAKQLARQVPSIYPYDCVALGLAKPTLSKESMLDSRLFNQQSLSNSFADDDSYNLYDKPLFHGSSAAAAIYKSRGNIDAGDDSAFGGAREQEVREGPVMFEKDTAGADVFGVDQFLDAAKRGEKRGLDTNVGGSRKKQQLERAEEE
ncbi:pre-mRNA-processing protein 45 [Rhizoctonia solani]|uniref:Pre-mRNA-processing protein 45 n=1 Tax=Rhizoctonia solani TaxID=456999 RepID=A0A8H8T2M9_9AGAM|nr:pre-mRNA-processing protein 45 [Rhizoctonia solani]QRW27671.1 pre-mRNA-processing protein 45 [Rhizoctonia solani]